jgi:hypothetical protein
MSLSGYFEELNTGVKEEVIELLQTCRNKAGADRLNALRRLWDIAFIENNRRGLVHPDLEYVPLMVHILETVDNEVVSIEKLSGGLWCLSASMTLRKYLGSPELRLVPALIRATSLSFTCKKNITNILMNISLERSIHPYLLRPEFGYVEFLKREITANPDNPIYYNSFQCLFTDIEAKNLPVTLDLGIHEFVLQRLIFRGYSPETWNEVAKRCLNILMYISRFPVGAQAIQNLHQTAYLYELAKDHHVHGMKAAFLIANCFGREEANSTSKSLLEDKPSILPLIRECLDVTIDYDPTSTKVKDMEGKGFVMGVIQINTIASALRNLSLSDKNKAIILQDKALLRNICACLEAFIHKAPQFGGVYNNMWRPAGGGGEDYFSVSNFIELLLQLSFFFKLDGEDDVIFLTSFDEIGEYRLSSLISVLLTMEDLPLDARRMCLCLINRFDQAKSSTDRRARASITSTLSSSCEEKNGVSGIPPSSLSSSSQDHDRKKLKSFHDYDAHHHHHHQSQHNKQEETVSATCSFLSNFPFPIPLPLGLCSHRKH